VSRSPAVRREILFQLSDVARAMRTFVDQCARAHGMTRAQWAVLLRLERQEGMTQAERAESLEIQPISLVRLIDRLDEQRLVGGMHGRPARQSPLSAAKGRSTLERLIPLGREISDDVLAAFSDREAGELLKTLLRIKTNIRRAAARDGARRTANGARHAG
jgi:MarR family transcriptional regulator for hemolysin